jgi:acyl-coenzyme A thioesterase PaaI-like protein
VIAALLDTACGFAASTVAGLVTASHFLMNCRKPAVGRRFIAKGVTLRAGRKQVFTTAELFAEDENDERTLIATGETLLVPIEEPSPARAVRPA